MRYATRTSVALLAGTLLAGGARGTRAQCTTAREAAAARKSARLAAKCKTASLRHSTGTECPTRPLLACARTRRVDTQGSGADDPSRAPDQPADLLTLTPAAAQALDPPPLRPNILFILTDDQRWDSAGAAQAPSGEVIMPRTLAELADSGVVFPNAYVTTPLCAPSRAGILTGGYAHRTGIYKNGGARGGAKYFDDASTVATWLRDAGYRTGLIGKYLNGYHELWSKGQPPYVPPGWTEWRGMPKVSYYDYTMVEPDGEGGYVERKYGATEADYLTDVLREKAKDFISQSVASGQPFFLYLAFKAPHKPWIPAPRHLGLFEGLPLWRPPNYDEANVSDKPTWLQDTPPLTAADEAKIDRTRIDQLEPFRPWTKRSVATRPTASPASWNTCAPSASPTTPS